MRRLITWSRFCLVIASMAIMVLAVLIIYPFSQSIVRQQVRIIWSRCLIASTGAKLNILGYRYSQDELRNSMIVSNHISWLDTVVMLRMAFVQYIGKVEMLKWPILNRLITAGGTIFIDRKNKKSLLNINQQVAKLLTAGATVGLYPEGKTSVGKEVLPFKAPLLEAALMANSTIIPIVLSYRKNNNRLAREVSFAKVGWLTTVLQTIRLKNLVINVTVLTPIRCSNFTTREQLVEYLYQQISECYHRQQAVNPN